MYKKGAGAVDGLKDMAKQLRRLPVVDLTLPTVRLHPNALISKPAHLSCSSAFRGVPFWTQGLQSVQRAPAQLQS